MLWKRLRKLNKALFWIRMLRKSASLDEKPLDEEESVEKMDNKDGKESGGEESS